MIFNLYKNRGETPLECLERFREKRPELKDESMTYLGRLDPLALGVLLVGTGEDTKQENRERYFGLDKEYEFTAIFGFATDTYDVMGKIVKVEKLEDLPEIDLIKIARLYQGEREQKYPLYSSKNIATGKNLNEIKKINIYDMQFQGMDTFSSKELFGRLLMDISRVNGNFRQNEILTLWREALLADKKIKEKRFLGRFFARVSSGTYIRSIVNDIGASLGVGATTFSIKRTRVGDFKIEDSLKF